VALNTINHNQIVSPSVDLSAFVFCMKEKMQLHLRKNKNTILAEIQKILGMRRN
jgi:hypothetical protein